MNLISQAAIVMLCLNVVPANAAIVTFNFYGALFQGWGPTPHDVGELGRFGERYTGNITYNSDTATTLNNEGLSHTVYRIDTGSFVLRFLDTGTVYSLSTNGVSSYLGFTIWNDFSVPLLGPARDQYRIDFIENQSTVFSINMNDSFIDGTDLSIINDSALPTSTTNFARFGFYSMDYAHYAAPYFSELWQVTGGSFTPPSEVPLPTTISLFISGLAGLGILKKRHLTMRSSRPGSATLHRSA